MFGEEARMNDMASLDVEGFARMSTSLEEGDDDNDDSLTVFIMLDLFRL